MSLKHLESLSITNFSAITVLISISFLKGLTKLQLISLDSLTGVSFLKDLPCIQFLSLSCQSLLDYTPLQSSKNLLSLELVFYGHSLEFMCDLTRINTLKLSIIPSFVDLLHLKCLINIEFLTLELQTLIHHDVDYPVSDSQFDLVFGSLFKLTDLDIIGFHFTSLYFLSKRLRLTHLSLSQCNQLKDVSVLASLPFITALSLYFCHEISDISPVVNSTISTITIHKCYDLHDFSCLLAILIFVV
ncbi:hypothetical protein RCL1_005182 [Eukaryota sp. TZLM3-RCL]